MWQVSLLVRRWLYFWEPRIQISLQPLAFSQGWSIKRQPRPTMPLLPYAREGQIQCSKGKWPILPWGVQPVSYQPLSFMGQATIPSILSTESRSCASGCRRIILLRITPTMRAYSSNEYHKWAGSRRSLLYYVYLERHQGQRGTGILARQRYG